VYLCPMEFISNELDAYVCKHTTPHSALLDRIIRETHLEVLQPRMLSGHFQGRVLSLIAKICQPKRILEIGTYTGFSALCLAEGLAFGGTLTTIDVNEELAQRVKGYFLESDYASQIDFRTGNALEIIPTLQESWDLVFIDADKKNYLAYYDLVVENTRPGGLILADNVLWSGKVIDPHATDRETELLRKYNETLHLDDRVENVLLPIRDGIMVARKK